MLGHETWKKEADPLKGTWPLLSQIFGGKE